MNSRDSSAVNHLGAFSDTIPGKWSQMSTDLRGHPRFIGLARAIDNCQFSATCVSNLDYKCARLKPVMISEARSDNGNVTSLNRKITVHIIA